MPPQTPWGSLRAHRVGGPNQLRRPGPPGRLAGQDDNHTRAATRAGRMPAAAGVSMATAAQRPTSPVAPTRGPPARASKTSLVRLPKGTCTHAIDPTHGPAQQAAECHPSKRTHVYASPRCPRPKSACGQTPFVHLCNNLLPSLTHCFVSGLEPPLWLIDVLHCNEKSAAFDLCSSLLDVAPIHR